MISLYSNDNRREGGEEENGKVNETRHAEGNRTLAHAAHVPPSARLGSAAIASRRSRQLSDISDASLAVRSFAFPLRR